jgi:AcrR family transcriptional regulator
MVQKVIDGTDRDAAADKARQILEGAMGEFITHGYAGTSMDRVAKTAKVSKATLYSYFQDKEGLFNALVQNMAKEKFAVIYDPRLLEGEPCVALRRLGETAMQQICCDSEQLAFIRLIIGESERFPNLAQTFVRHVTKPGIEFITQYLASCPTLDIPDPEATARIMIGSFVYFVQVQELLHGKEILPMQGDRMVDALLHLLLKCLKPADA